MSFPIEPVQLHGHGLHLREWRDEDLPAMSALFDDPEVARWTPLASPFDEAAAAAYLQRARQAREARLRLQFAVTRDGGQPLGEVLAMRRVDQTGAATGVVEIGYAIGAAHRGQGLASAGVRLLTEYAYTELDARQVVLRIEPDNAASAAVARSTGYHLADEPPVVVTDPDGAEVVLRVWEHRR
ncbi:GNAT family N-acetyltransferase [Streptacidiphilus monticola]|jgi:RimJ/RimL family protein N-acetyltransferase|uniref:GNAT family N-acetyltransferase n=1 Tax=Streptacidiphilus monticola TaxID=2161674 RepID=A0ABW1G100_9ACTN